MFLFLSGNGCLIIPSSMEEPISGREVSKENLDFVQIGGTTKTEISERLGTPTVFWADKNIFAYNWKILSWHFLWVDPTGHFGGGDIDEDHILLIQFDRDNLVERFELTVHSPWDSYGDHLTKWSEKGKD
jgi:outer membrane protein assembly factor BamE (lipoprotein component of BamABCDE complex)